MRVKCVTYELRHGEHSTDLSAFMKALLGGQVLSQVGMSSVYVSCLVLGSLSSV